MLNLFSLAKQLFSSNSRPQEMDDRSDDPLSHPALQRMTLEQLADLPFDRTPPTARCSSPRAAERVPSCQT